MELPTRHHCHRPGADRGRATAPYRCSRQVRPFLRARCGQRTAGEPGHDRQHEPRVRGHLRHLSDRRRHPGLPAADRLPRTSDPAGGGRQKEQGPWHETDHEPTFSQTIELDLSTVEPSIAGPKRPQDRIPLRVAPQAYRRAAVRTDIRRRGGSGPGRGFGRICFRRAIRSRSVAIIPAMGPTCRAPTAMDPTGRAGRLRSEWTGAVPSPQRRCRDRRDHLLYEYLQPVGDGRRGAAGEKGCAEGPGLQAVGQDLAGARFPGRYRLLRKIRATTYFPISSASTWWATVAPPASATPGH